MGRPEQRCSDVRCIEAAGGCVRPGVRASGRERGGGGVSAARGRIDGRSTVELAGQDLAKTVAAVGVGNWPRFLAVAEQRAVGAAEAGAVPGFIKASAPGVDPAPALILSLISLGLMYESSRSKPSVLGTRAPSPGADSADVLEIRPPKDAKDPNGTKAPGKPGKAEGFRDPKGGERWVKNPNGKGYGWLDDKGRVWVPTGPAGSNGFGPGEAHGGAHWDIQSPGGGYVEKFPVGRGARE